MRITLLWNNAWCSFFLQLLCWRVCRLRLTVQDRNFNYVMGTRCCELSAPLLQWLQAFFFTGESVNADLQTTLIVKEATVYDNVTVCQ